MTWHTASLVFILIRVFISIGGYDPRVYENLSTYNELCDVADSLKLKHATAKSVITAKAIPGDISILFLHSVPNAFKATLLSSSRLLVYTPRNEHFGIVPLEAMLAGIPVLAADEGGPTETVVDGETGWLRDVTKIEDWTQVMRLALADAKGEEKLKHMGRKGRKRVKAEFSKEKMAERLESEIQGMMHTERAPIFAGTSIILGLGVAGAVIGAMIWSLL